MQRNAESCAHRAFTLIELMVVVAIIAILIAILLPSLARARQQAYQVKCAANLKGIGLGIFYYVNDHNGYLPLVASGFWFGTDAGALSSEWPPFWATQILPYIKIRRSKVGSKNGLFRCPADDNPPYRVLTGTFAGSFVGEAIKVRADSGQDISGTSQRRGRGGSGGGQGPYTLGPLIEPVSYAGSMAHRVPGPDARHRTPKLAELGRPYCQVLFGEVYNGHDGFLWSTWLNRSEWSWQVSGHGGHVTERKEAQRHYGGMNPDTNGSNWLFVDGHVQWHSVTSFDKLLCCQDFPRGISLHEMQAQRCGGGAGSSGSGGGATRRR